MRTIFCDVHVEKSTTMFQLSINRDINPIRKQQSKAHVTFLGQRFLHLYLKNSQSEHCIQYIQCSDWMI